MAGKTRGYAHRVDIAAPRTRVWTALVEPKLLARWYGPGAEVRPREGGSFDSTLDPGIPHEDDWNEYYLALRVHSERALLRLKVLMERKVAPPVVPGVSP